MTPRSCAAVAMLGALIAGCGYKGPLMLPEPTGPVIIRPAPQDPKAKPTTQPPSASETASPAPPPAPETPPPTPPAPEGTPPGG